MGIQKAKQRGVILSPRSVYIFTLGIFAVCVLIRFLLAVFTKSMAVYMDELRYYDIARSLWQSGEIAIRNIPENNYNKILYSLFIAPAFSLPSIAAQTRAIALINSVLVASAVFPALLIAKRCIEDTRWQLVVVGLVALLPDMAYSMTYMSEVSALPLTLWVVLACWCALEARLPRKAALQGAVAGALCYLLYMNKEVALAYPIAFGAALVFLWFAQKPRRRALLASLGGYLAGFILLLLLAQLLLPGGLGSSYGQTDLAYYDSAEKWLYLLYALLFNAATALIAFLYLPVVLGLFRFKALGPRRQSLYVFCLTALAVLVVVIAYSITVREDFGERMPRQHIRYYGPLLVPLLALCLGQLVGGVRFDYKNRRLAAVLIGSTALLGIACVLVFLQPVYGGFVDNTLYKYFTLFSVSAKRFWAVKAALCVAVGFGTWALFKWNKRFVAVAFTGGLALVLLLNNYATIRNFRVYYSVSVPDAQNIEAIDAYVKEQGGNTLVLMHYEYTHRENLILDTWVTGHSTAFSWVFQYQAHRDENGPALAEAPYPLLDYDMADSGVALDAVKYVILPAGWQMGEGAQEIESLRGTFSLYELEDPGWLPALSKKSVGDA